MAQTRQQPMETLDIVRDHAAAVRRLESWDRVGVLIDEGPEAVVTTLLVPETVVGAARFSLSVEDSVSAIRAYGGEAGETELRCWQGHTLTTEQLVDLDELSGIWRKAASQRSEQTADDWKEFFARIEEGTREKGRGARAGTIARHEVLLAAHGRCMFEGCGVDLTEDAVTGERGSFATLAHKRCFVGRRHAGRALFVRPVGGRSRQHPAALRCAPPVGGHCGEGGLPGGEAFGNAQTILPGCQ